MKKGRPVGSVRKNKEQKAYIVSVSLHKEVIDKLDKKVFLLSNLMNKKQSRSSVVESILIDELMED